MILKSLITIIASLGFGIIFNIHGKKLIFAAIGGGLSWFVYSLAINLGMNEIPSLFISSLALSIYSEVFARILNTPVTTLIIVSLLPLVPGSGMYYTMYEAILGNVHNSINTGLKTLASAGTIAIGVIFVSTIVKQITYKRRKKTL